MLESLSGRTCDMKNKNAILEHIQNELEGKVYLLVLNNVWDEDIKNWEDLRDSLLGMKESKQSSILVTSSENVAVVRETPLDHRRHLKAMVSPLSLATLNNDRECTINLEDVQLQLGLPVDGSVATRSIQSVDWGASEYIEIWENRYDHIPDRKPIIVPELAYTLDYMPWFRIHGKPYLLSEEQRRRTHTITGPNASIDDTHITALSDYARLECMAQCISFPDDSNNSNDDIEAISPEGSHLVPLTSSSHYHSSSSYGIQTPPPWVMQTPPHSLFYQGGSSS
ncbi:hypothetical protein PVK06_034636 [Gossypium arboreum]|uniref:NB-ARC domain-containing protein n=1 Tax=Gossypium arboreum TaxID=29729 RepID=A0ABR0NFP3_GOSAR|nr:hypothetical protein PVK06_034636 [Gossypium arboreum]